MGPSQAFSIFPLFFEKISKDSLEFTRRSGHSCSVQSDCLKDMVMKNILKYSDKYLTVEVIQGKKLFKIRYACVGGESNPGLSRGRREFYH